MTTFDERDMENIFAPLQQTTASQTLRDRAIGAARVKATPRRRYIYGFVAAAAAVTAVIAMLPRKAGAEAMFDNVIRAMKGVERAHFEVLFNGPKGWMKAQEAWYDDGNWRIVTDRSEEVYAGDTKWVHVKGEDTALRASRQSGEQPAGFENGFGVNASLDQMRRSGFHIRLEPGQKGTVNGHAIQRFVATREGHNERSTYLVDQTTDLPLSIEEEIFTKRGWQLRMQVRCDYSTATPSGAFEPSFGPGVRVVDLDGLRQDLIRKLANPLQTLTFGSEKVDVRDVFVGHQGWVYVLWTGKIGGNDYRLHLTDDKGNAYARACFNPGLIPGQQSKRRLVNIDGQVVDGAWFVPIQPMEVAGTRQYTLRVDKVTVGGPDPIHVSNWFRRPWEPEVCLDSDHPMYTITPVGNQTFDGTASLSETPNYLPVLAEYSTDQMLKIWENDARIWSWAAKLGKDFNISSVVHRNGPAVLLEGTPCGPNVQLIVPRTNLEPGKYDPAVLREILALRQNAVRLDSDLDPSGEGSGFDWFEIAQLQHALGHDQAAEEAYRTAERIRPEIKWR